MRELSLNIDQRQVSRIVIGRDLAAQVRKYIGRGGGRNVIYITQKPLLGLLEAYLGPGEGDVLALPSGEDQKKLTNATDILKFLMSRRADSKSTLVVAFGGGALTDIAGFAASIYKRGVPIIYVPTSLLAMVDASIGGKNGVNLEGAKNMLGTIRNPEAIFVDADLLKDLPAEEFKAGLGELAKLAICYDRKLFELLKESPAPVKNLEEVIALGIADKVRVVESDPLETSGKRYVLNFGHTLGHALESISDYRMRHGYAVAVGCHFAAFISKEKGYITDDDYQAIRKLMTGLGLPTDADFLVGDVVKFMRSDKKKIDADRINFVLIKAIGEPSVEPLSFADIEDYLVRFKKIRSR